MNFLKVFLSASLSLIIFIQPVLAMESDQENVETLLSISSDYSGTYYKGLRQHVVEVVNGYLSYQFRKGRRRCVGIMCVGSLVVIVLGGIGYAIYKVIEKEDKNSSHQDIPEINIEMIHLPGGKFLMGSNSSDAEDNEQPVHPVYLDSFNISAKPIHFGLYTTVINQGPKMGYDFNVGQPGAYAPNGRNTPYNERKGVNTSDKDFHPVTFINFYDVIKFVNILTEMKHLTPCYRDGDGVFRSGNANDISFIENPDCFRIPTEAQVEYFERGGKEQKTYPWGDNINKTLSNYAYYYNGTLAVNGTDQYLTENDYNISQPVGNVYIWCWDWASDDYYKEGPENNPTGPSSGDLRIIRGCGWPSDVQSCRVSHRDAGYPDAGNYNLGFRIATGG